MSLHYQKMILKSAREKPLVVVYQESIEKIENIIRNLFLNPKRKALLITNIHAKNLSIQNKYCLTLSRKGITYIQNTPKKPVKFEFDFNDYPENLSDYLPFIKNAISDLSYKKAWVVDA